MEPFIPFLKLSLLVVFILLVAGFLAPRGIFSIAAISLKPSLVAAALLLGALLFFGGAPLIGALAIATAAVGTAFLLPYYRSSQNVPDPELTIVWANVLKRKSSAAKAIRLGEKHGAEIVMLGEAPLTFTPPKGWYLRSNLRPVAVLTRTPGERVEELFGSRTASIRFSYQGFDVFGTHMPMPLLGFQAATEREAALEVLSAQISDGPTIVVGDFNTVPWSSAFLDVEEEAELSRVGTGAKTTWLSPLLFLGLPIDHLLVSKDVEASAEVGPGIGSDHRPLIVRAKHR
jgi:endonuclease/exonuclease/phosphatase (EEP) superfamily protein YafD